MSWHAKERTESHKTQRRVKLWKEHGVVALRKALGVFLASQSDGLDLCRRKAQKQTAEGYITARVMTVLSVTGSNETNDISLVSV